MVAIEIEGIGKRFGAVDVLRDVNLSVHDRELLAVLGPSGSGKSTLLRIVAGLEKPDRGTVAFGGVDVTAREPADRNVSMVFQDNALYPFMTVRRNVSFPLEVAGTDPAEIDRRVTAESRVLAIEQLLERMPAQLSAGHQQLAQAARAMVRVPAVFLMDEPLARLDTHLRLLMRRELRLLQQGYGVTTLFATNDQADALAVSDRVAVIGDGVVQQVGTSQELYRMPVNVFVAGFVGTPPMNLLEAVPVAGVGGGYDLRVLGVRHRVWTNALAPLVGRVVTVGIRPEDISVHPGGEGVVELVEDLGEARNLTATFPGGERVVARSDLRVEPGARVGAEIVAVHLFDPNSGVALYHPL